MVVVGKAIALSVLVALTLAGLKSLDSLKEEANLGYHLDELHALGAETVFVGSSRTHSHVDAALFDRLGGGANSYTLGLDGASGVEILYWADYLLGLPHVRTLVVELREIPFGNRGRNATTRRILHAYDLRRTHAAARVALTHDAPLARRLRAALSHYRACLTRYSMLGQGRALLRGWSNPPEPSVARLTRRGYAPMETIVAAYPEHLHARRAALVSPEGRARFAVKVMQIVARHTTPPTRADAAAATVWLEFAERAAAHGAEVFFVEQVGEVSTGGVARVLADTIPDRVLLLNDPAAYPHLFDPAGWYDLGHLKRERAENLTAILADFIARRDACCKG